MYELILGSSFSITSNRRSSSSCDINLRLCDNISQYLVSNNEPLAILANLALSVLLPLPYPSDKFAPTLSIALIN